MQHPTHSVLENYARQTLSERDANHLFDHLAVCEQCAERLDELESRELGSFLGKVNEPAALRANALIVEPPYARMIQQACGAKTPFDGLGSSGSVPVLTRSSGQGNPVPEEVGPYRLVEQIGQGGFGVVYLAEQTDPIRRQVAIKLIKPGMDSERVIWRFEAERQALALMDHPNIAQVFDAGTTNVGYPFFVMELVNGQAITNYCDSRRYSLQQRLRLVRDVCAAVQHAHQKGIIHRDIKPSNVLVTDKNDQPVVKVIDFGVAKALDEPLLEHELETRSTHAVGTPLYMSPEQAGQEGQGIDTRSDIYSLGVLLYELLTGTTPFERSETTRPNREDVLKAIVSEEPANPSARVRVLTDRLPAIELSRGLDTQKLCRKLQGDLDWMVMKCLTKERERRYQTVAELSDDIERHLSSEPISASPPSLIYRVRKFARKHLAALVTAVVLLSAIFVGAGIATWQAVRATQAEERTATMAARNERVLDFLVSAFGRPNPAVDGKDVTVVSVLEPVLEELLDPGGNFAKDELEKALLLHKIAETFHELGLPSKSVPANEAALAIRERLLGTTDKHAIASRTSLAANYLFMGELAKAVENSEAACAAAKVSPEVEPLQLESAINLLAESYKYSGRANEAIPLYEEIIAKCNRIVGGDSAKLLCSVQSNLAQALFELGKKEKALALFENAWEQSIELQGKEHPQTLMFMTNLAHAHMKSGNVDTAIPLLEESLKLHESKLGVTHPETLIAKGNLAQTHYFSGQFEPAIRLTEETLAVMTDQLGEEHFHTITSLYNLGRFYQEAGDLEHALPRIERAKDLRVRLLGPNHPSTLTSCRALALLRLEMGQIDSAILELDEYVDLERIRFLEEPTELANILEYVSEALIEFGQSKAAMPHLESSLEIRESNPQDRWALGLCQSLLGAAMLPDGDNKETERLLIAGYQAMKASGDGSKPKAITEAIDRIVRFYESTDQIEESEKWIGVRDSGLSEPE